MGGRKKEKGFSREEDRKCMDEERGELGRMKVHERRKRKTRKTDSVWTKKEEYLKCIN